MCEKKSDLFVVTGGNGFLVSPTLPIQYVPRIDGHLRALMLPPVYTVWATASVLSI